MARRLLMGEIAVEASRVAELLRQHARLVEVLTFRLAPEKLRPIVEAEDDLAQRLRGPLAAIDAAFGPERNAFPRIDPPAARRWLTPPHGLID